MSHERHLLWVVFETSSRRHIKDVFLEMYSRRLKNVSKKTSFWRCIWEFSKMSQERHLLRCIWDVSKMCLSTKTWLRCLRDVLCRLGKEKETSYRMNQGSNFLQAVLAVKTALEIKIFLVPVNWSLQHQSRWSSYPPWRSQDCLFPLTKWIRTVEFGVLAIKKTSVRSLQIGLYSVFLSVPIKHVHEKEK